MGGLSGRSSDNAKPTAAYRDFDVRIGSPIDDCLCPGVDRAGFGIATVIEVGCGDFCTGQHESDAMTYAFLHGVSRFGVRRPCCGIVVFSAEMRKSCLERRLRQLTRVAFRPEPYDPLITLKKWSERNRQHIKVAIESPWRCIRCVYPPSVIHCDEPSSRKDCDAVPVTRAASVRISKGSGRLLDSRGPGNRRRWRGQPIWSTRSADAD